MRFCCDISTSSGKNFRLRSLGVIFENLECRKKLIGQHSFLPQFGHPQPPQGGFQCVKHFKPVKLRLCQTFGGIFNPWFVARAEPKPPSFKPLAIMAQQSQNMPLPPKFPRFRNFSKFRSFFILGLNFKLLIIYLILIKCLNIKYIFLIIHIKCYFLCYFLLTQIQILIWRKSK